MILVLREHKEYKVRPEQPELPAGTSMQTGYVMWLPRIPTLIRCVMRLIAKEHRGHKGPQA